VRLKDWLTERWFDIALWWDRRAIRQRQNEQAEREAHFVGQANGTRYIGPHEGYTKGRLKPRSPRRRR
jgi:hypothetical protein